MKIYFSAAIAQRDELGDFYKRIISKLESLGHVVQHEHVTKTSIDLIKKQSDADFDKHYQNVLKWVTSSDIVFVEASYPSTLNIGHEITLALDRGKPVVALYKTGRSSLFLQGLNSDRLFLMEYSDESLDQIVTDSLEFAKDSSDTRFNFFISPRHISYLDWVSKSKKIPRSVYLRQLIDRDKSRNFEFSPE